MLIRAAARVLRGLGGEEPALMTADLSLLNRPKRVHHEPKGCGEYERGQDKGMFAPWRSRDNSMEIMRDNILI
jgi:hypothetical protein